MLHDEEVGKDRPWQSHAYQHKKPFLAHRDQDLGQQSLCIKDFRRLVTDIRDRKLLQHETKIFIWITEVPYRGHWWRCSLQFSSAQAMSPRATIHVVIIVWVRKNTAKRNRVAEQGSYSVLGRGWRLSLLWGNCCGTCISPAKSCRSFQSIQERSKAIPRRQNLNNMHRDLSRQDMEIWAVATRESPD